MISHSFIELESSIRGCQHCAACLPLPPKPILQIHPDAKILIAGQAPGQKAHEAGRPFDDPSGDRLRQWLGVSKDVFYDAKQIALVPMGFCFPGTGKSGDLPPRKECAELWRAPLLAELKCIELVIVLGSYAQAYHLGVEGKASVTEQVKHWKDYLAQGKLPLPHPSPRNNRWLKQNPWFEEEVLPALKMIVERII
ncbi:Uracil DNA glycosylase superfamily protein [Marinomonas spartinae]|uniref:Uracil DNA glycosylase superfamily protein n=1 Tax=Marinomonas spartinae TaxID=1792290 RepID=A0A1A8TQN1_9GAMM|nr:uracil-DNA glycosylase family protein [Marinomonas spartinae]SBS32991.1 Uracil DNA glycosylase superfamily protein [Marinomonas spartinae]SBS35762.1 Uracil DNA glycosylase superfamily protein [Marinomonas spartinae]